MARVAIRIVLVGESSILRWAGTLMVNPMSGAELGSELTSLGKEVFIKRGLEDPGAVSVKKEALAPVKFSTR